MNTSRDNRFLNMVTVSNEYTKYSSNMGKKWNNEEEIILLDELNNNIGIEIIAQKHGRTTGAINARCREIAYKMYLKNVSIEEIIRKTKLDNTSIEETIKKRQNNKSKKLKIKK